jgi:GT2 family glycosyltransferase
MRFPSIRLIIVQELMLYKMWKSARRLFAEPPTISEPTSCDWVYGASMLVRRKALQAVGGFDHHLWMYGEEMELCYRLRLAGQETIFEPNARVVHYGEGSWRGDAARPIALRQRGLLYFYSKHRSTLEMLTVWVFLLVGTIARCAGSAVWVLVNGARFRHVEEGRKRFAIYSSVLLRLFMPPRT